MIIPHICTQLRILSQLLFKITHRKKSVTTSALPIEKGEDTKPFKIKQNLVSLTKYVSCKGKLYVGLHDSFALKDPRHLSGQCHKYLKGLSLFLFTAT